MNNEDFVTYDIAVRLKEVGFDWPCRTYWMKTYIDKDIMNLREDLRSSNHNEYAPDYYSAPTLAQAQKWLREIVGIHVAVTPAIQIRKWQFYLDDLSQHINPHDGELLTRCTEDMQDEYDKEYFDTYESALSAGIEAALKLIEEGEG